MSEYRYLGSASRREEIERERKGGEAHSSDENDSLESLSKNGDERKEEESPLSSSTLVLVVVLESNRVLLDGGGLLLPVEEAEGRGRRVDVGLVESSLKLDSPLGSRSVHSEEGDTHDEAEGTEREQGE